MVPFSKVSWLINFHNIAFAIVLSETPMDPHDVADQNSDNWAPSESQSPAFTTVETDDSNMRSCRIFSIIDILELGGAKLHTLPIHEARIVSTTVLHT